MIEVISPGLLGLIEDAGRIGLAHLGVPRSGAADGDSFALANRLVGNQIGAAAIELTYGSAELRFGANAWVAVTGAEAPLSLGGRPVATNQALRARTGDLLKIGVPLQGLRTYVAVGGGIDVPPVLGSRSRDTLAGLGPAPLRPGDLLALGPAGCPPASPDVVRGTVPGLVSAPLEYRLGPRDDRFGPDVIAQLGATAWQVSSASNRVGVRLLGERLPVPAKDPLPSEGIVLGSIEVPPSGQPIIFLADHPTTGGYPVIGVLSPRSVARLAQLPPGSTARLKRVP